MVRAMSAAVDQLRRRQISNSARQMRGAFWLTYIMSAVSEKLSARARPTYACVAMQHICSRCCITEPLPFLGVPPFLGLGSLQDFEGTEILMALSNPEQNYPVMDFKSYGSTAHCELSDINSALTHKIPVDGRLHIQLRRHIIQRVRRVIKLGFKGEQGR